MFYSLNMLEKKKIRLYICQSVGVISPLAAARVLGFGLRAVFAQSLSISQILKAERMAVVLCWICMMVYSVYMIKIFMDTPCTNKYRCWNAGYDAQFNSLELFLCHFGRISESTLQTETAYGQLKEISYFYLLKIARNWEWSQKLKSSQKFSFESFRNIFGLWFWCFLFLCIL